MEESILNLFESPPDMDQVTVSLPVKVCTAVVFSLIVIEVFTVICGAVPSMVSVRTSVSVYGLSTKSLPATVT